MRAASSITGLPFTTVQAAKRAGCDAFNPQGSVNCDRLIEWLADNKKILEQSGDNPNFEIERALKTRAERKLKEHDLELKRRNSIPTVEVRSVLVRSLFAFRRRLFEIPKRCAQSIAAESDSVLISERVEKELTEAMADLAKGDWWYEHDFKA